LGSSLFLLSPSSVFFLFAATELQVFAATERLSEATGQQGLLQLLSDKLFSCR
jgi:hypothetical protein